MLNTESIAIEVSRTSALLTHDVKLSKKRQVEILDLIFAEF